MIHLIIIMCCIEYCRGYYRSYTLLAAHEQHDKRFEHLFGRLPVDTVSPKGPRDNVKPGSQPQRERVPDKGFAVRCAVVAFSHDRVACTKTDKIERNSNPIVFVGDGGIVLRRRLSSGASPLGPSRPMQKVSVPSEDRTRCRR